MRIFHTMLSTALKRGAGKGALCNETRLRLYAFGKNFYFYITSLFDLRILKDVFMDGEYELELKYRPKIVFDIGANVGVSSVYFSLKYPDAEIFAFEPDKNIQEQLRKNIKQFQNIKLSECAITDRDGPTSFYSSIGRSESSSLIERKDKAIEVQEVEGETLDKAIEIADGNNIDLLKCDAEGGEWSIFHDSKKLNRIKNVIIEVHLDLLPVSEGEFLSLFESYTIEKRILSPERYILVGSRPDAD